MEGVRQYDTFDMFLHFISSVFFTEKMQTCKTTKIQQDREINPLRKQAQNGFIEPINGQYWTVQATEHVP
jgi:hypothetical protein